MNIEQLLKDTDEAELFTGLVTFREKDTPSRVVINPSRKNRDTEKALVIRYDEKRGLHAPKLGNTPWPSHNPSEQVVVLDYKTLSELRFGDLNYNRRVIVWTKRAKDLSTPLLGGTGNAPV